MNVLLTGATGYIGSVVAEALRQAGHSVVGVARSDEAAERLQERGHQPVRGDLSNPEGISAAARDADAVIHTASTNDMNAPAADQATTSALLDALAGSGKRYVYTGGVWVYGNTDEAVVDEDSPLNPPMIVAWRPAVENLVLAAQGRGVHPIVLRPAMVYGRGGGLPAMLVGQARGGGPVRYPGTGENHWPLVHVDDLADLYVRALEQAPIGAMYLGATDETMRLRALAEEAARLGGDSVRAEAWPLDEARAAMGPLADALALDQHVSGAKAMRELGWAPHAPSLADELGAGSYSK